MPIINSLLKQQVEAVSIPPSKYISVGFATASIIENLIHFIITLVPTISKALSS